jgi:phosphohistidine phosphatase
MQLYLVRHAHAVTAEENPARPLSDRGRAQVARLITYFSRSGTFLPDEIWCSHLVRSRETASLLTVGLSLSVPLLECPDLEPESDPRRTITRIAGATRPLAIVGHEPHLGALAGLLLEGSSPLEPVAFKKGTVLALARRPGKPWWPLWHISPDSLEPGGTEA